MPHISSIISYEQKLLKLIRVFNTRSMVLFYALGRAIGGSLQLDKSFVIAVGIFITTYAFSSALNFSYDKKVDKLNKRDNPLIKDKQILLISRSVLFLSPFFALVFALVGAKQLDIFTAIILLFLGILYSHPAIRLSYHPFGKLFSMALNYSIIPALYGFSQGREPYENVFVLLAICLFYVSWIPYSDIKDIGGDKKAGKRTLAVVLGVRGVILFSIVGTLIALVSLYLIHSFGAYVQGIIITVFISFLALEVYAYFRPSILLEQKYREIGGYAMLLFLVVLVFSFI